MASVLFSLLSSATIKGTIYDQKTKEPLIGASIFIEDKGIGAASDVDGSFILQNIRSCSTCTYTLKSTYIGYKTLTKNIDLFKNQDIILDLFLESQSVDIDETTVTAERRQMKITDSPAAVEIVSAGDIKRESATNLGSYLDGIKGVDFSSSGINNYSISVRGFNSSFSSRLLTLSDGRIANIPALRVINYSTLPQSSNDIESIEIVLGPATALYGANAHSGVVSITSKSPADSEGFDLSVTSSINDNRDLSKLDTRWASKLTKDLSIKASASYLKAYDWEFVSEEEYKIHTYPYSGTPKRMYDKKDNNPWVDDFANLTYEQTSDNRIVRIGNGENNETGDPDNDGVEGEDWYNGYDDDNDGLIDEDYFIADGIDNDGDCLGDTNNDGCVCCGWNDVNRNGIWDPTESNNGDEGVDEGIDTKEDKWFDGVDNDQNGLVDDGQEQFTGSQAFPNWRVNLENNVIIFEGRNRQYINSEPLDDYGTDGLNANGAPVGEELFDWGIDGIPARDLNNDGDYEDPYELAPDFGEGNGVFDEGESFVDCGFDGLCPGDEGYPILESTGEPFADPGEGDGIWQPGLDSNGTEANEQWDCLNPEQCESFVDYNGDGVWTEGDYNYWYLNPDPDGDGEIDYPDDNLDLRGAHYYDEELVKLIFDVFLYDFGYDNLPGDHAFTTEYGRSFGFTDGTGNNGFFDGLSEGRNQLTFQGDTYFISSEPCAENAFFGNGQCGDHEGSPFDDTFEPRTHDCGLDGICPEILQKVDPDCTLGCSYEYISNPAWIEADWGEGNGLWDNFDWNNDGEYNTGELWNFDVWDTNNNNIIDLDEIWSDDSGDGIYGNQGDILLINENTIIWEDTYPYANGIYSPNDYGDQLLDCGQDGLCPGDQYWIDTNEDGIYGNQGDKLITYLGPDYGESDNILRETDTSELDRIFDTGDGCFGCEEEPFVDIDQNGRYTKGEPFTDTNGDGIWTPKDYEDNFDITDDVNGDGLADYPDFEVLNAKADLRIDYDPSEDLNLTFSTGYSWSKTNQVTGTGRYLADGYQYTYYLLRSRFKNLSTTFYINEGNSGNTRGYLLGNRINDESKNISLGMQHWFWGPSKKYPKSTKIIYGFDYFKTIANSNGTILNDGPNGYDNDGDAWVNSANNLDDDFDSSDYYDLNGNGYPDPGDFNPDVLGEDGIFGTDDDNMNVSTGVNPDGIVFKDNIDQDGDGLIDEMIDEKFCFDPNNPDVEDPDLIDDFYKSGERDGRVWECSEGVDEKDEFVNVTSQEMGVYFQTITNPKGNKKWEIITALRIDKHDRLEEKPGVQPKFGLVYKPNDFHEFTFSYGRAFNTPNAITLYTDLFINRIGPFSFYSRGNRDGTPYVRVGEQLEINKPQVSINGMNYPIGSLFDGYWEGNAQNAAYTDRVQGAPYFLAFNSDFINVTDYIPLDTAIYTIYVPELNDTGRVYTPEEAINIPDVEPIKTEKIQTLELGFQGFLTEKIYGSLNYYQSQYQDFFSGPTIITPYVVERNLNHPQKITNAEFALNHIVGMLPANSLDSTLSNPPFGTQWDGKDNDNDWSIKAIDSYGNFTDEVIGVNFPYYENNASKEGESYCEPYSSGCFEITNLYNVAEMNPNFANEHFNLDTDSDGINDAFDWSKNTGFGWESSIDGDPQWGYVDYITCGGIDLPTDNDGELNYPWHGGDISCFGEDGVPGNEDDFINYTTGENAAYGDTIGVTIYHPEDVIIHSYAEDYGNISFGSSYMQEAQFWQAVGIDEYDVVSRLSEAEKIISPIIGADKQNLEIPGTAFTPLHAILAPLNYGSTKMSGIDVGLTYFLRQYNITFDTNFSFYNSTEYYNKLTKKNDPINAPKFKMNASLMWDTEKFGTIGIKYKHVDQYLWKDGIWSGIIGPYDLIDLLYNYKLNEYLGLNITIQNLFNDVHKEMVGGPFMTRQITMRLSANI